MGSNTETLAQLEQIIRDLPPAHPTWQQAANEYVELQKQLELQERLSKHITKEVMPPKETTKPLPWES